jgi:hypothetical protein
MPRQQTLATMYHHILLSLLLVIKSVFDLIPIQFVKSFKIFSRCLPLSLFPTILPVVTACSVPPLRRICPMNFDYIFLTSLNTDVSTSACCNMTSFDTFAVHGTFNILLSNHISVASSCLFRLIFLLFKSHFYNTEPI